MKLMVGFAFGVVLFASVGACNQRDSRSQTATTTPPPVGSSSTMPGLASEPNLNQAPNWYNGSKPWTDISPEGRRTLLQQRAAYESFEAKAREPGEGSNDALAEKGNRLIKRVVRQYGLNAADAEPITFGSKMTIWLPETAWNRFSDEEKNSIKAFMSNHYANWAIGVGKVVGGEVQLDRVVVDN